MAGVLLEMRRHPRPIVAVVQGRALGGGCGIATAADIVLAADSAQFGYPEINIGFVPAVVMAILRRMVSEKRANDHAFTRPRANTIFMNSAGSGIKMKKSPERKADPQNAGRV